MPIKTTINRSEDLTEHCVTGDITREDIFACQQEFYDGDPTMLQLWDMPASNLQLTYDEIREFVRRAVILGETRRGGRTAVVVNSQVQFGLGKMAEAFGQFESLPFDFQMFYDRSEAIVWLQKRMDD